MVQTLALPGSLPCCVHDISSPSLLIITGVVDERSPETCRSSSNDKPEPPLSAVDLKRELCSRHLALGFLYIINIF